MIVPAVAGQAAAQRGYGIFVPEDAASRRRRRCDLARRLIFKAWQKVNR
jgi:hypothetical protein